MSTRPRGILPARITAAVARSTWAKLIQTMPYCTRAPWGDRSKISLAYQGS